MRAVGLALAAALLAGLAPTGEPAQANPAAPLSLTVAGESGWRADTHFPLTWTNPSTAGDPPLAAVHFRVRDPRGVVVEEEELQPTIQGVSVRARTGYSGIYSAEVWLEDSGGALGPAAATELRFDDARPAVTEPAAVAEWLGRASFPLRVRLSHPAGPLPLSGIRGYAVSVDPAPGASPCAAADRCDEAETTLRGGIDEDELVIPALPQGTAYLHAVAVSGTGMKSAEAGQAVLRIDTADPVTELFGAPPGWTNRPVSLAAVASDGGAGMKLGGDASPAPFTAIRVDDGAPRIALGASTVATVIGEGAHRVTYYARDAAGNVDDGARGNGVANSPPRLAWVRIDRTPPEIAFTNSQDPRDPDLVRVRVADPLSGPDLNRGSIAVRRAGGGERFQPLPAESPAGGALSARWASDAYPRGEYEFRAVAYDAAGNAAVTTLRQNGSAMVLTNPLKATTALRAAFHRPGKRRLAPYGRRVRIGGRLTTGTGRPLPGMPIRVVERFAPGASPATRTSIVRTGPGGGFSLRTSSGPNRKLELSFAGTPTLARATGPTLALRVRTRVRLRASARVAKVGGAPIVFRGRLLAGTGSAADRSVQLQFRLPGLPWSSFRTLKTNHRGRFRYAYRFSDDDSRGARFQFRAFAPTQKDWPYEPGGSRPVLVRGY